MKIRIKEKSIEGVINYSVQVKRCLYWKTVNTTSNLDSAAEIVENLKKMEEINKTNEDKIVCIGWMARNQYENTGISSVIDVYSEYPEYKRSDNKKTIYWSGNQIVSIKTKTHLFGEIGLEPRKIKITIEKL